MKTIGEILKLSQKHLADQGIANARRSAEELLAFHLKISRLDLYLNFEMPIQEKELVGIRESLKRRSKGEPLEYIFGKMKFFQLELVIDPSVLIPRQETEIFISKIVKVIKARPHHGKVAWDICCGSGCLGLGLKKSLPDLAVILSDLSSRALAIAKLNCENNGLQAEFLHGDLLQPFEGRKADFILFNPPYVTQKEYEALDAEVRNFEPKEALVAGPNGVEFYERLARELPSYLNPGAKLFFEIGSTQAEQIKNIFSSSCWTHLVVEKDWAGHDRFVFLEYFS
ncbi:MAG TPA: peptide chain release factor N(5)-glutamine methyltransferase [Rhabdochlamydiaceae bacterium]|nr:peptide chain release factor N(5)-glutamine methyltransferase [Rhabdochlamydiaceae bacterium]